MNLWYMALNLDTEFTQIFLLNTGFVNTMIHSCNSILFPLFAIKLKKNSGCRWMKVVYWTIIPFYFIFRVLIYKCLSHRFQLYCNECLHTLFLPSEQILLMDHSLCFSQSLFQSVKHAFQKALPFSLTLFKRLSAIACFTSWCLTAVIKHHD